MAIELTGVIGDHIAAVNALDIDAIVDTFADDAYVNDAHREIVGKNAIRQWMQKEMVDDNVTMEPQEVIHHYGDTIVRATYDGDYDKSLFPDGEMMTNYISVRDNKIVSMVIVHNKPSEY